MITAETFEQSKEYHANFLRRSRQEARQRYREWAYDNLLPLLREDPERWWTLKELADHFGMVSHGMSPYIGATKSLYQMVPLPLKWKGSGNERYEYRLKPELWKA